MSNAPAQEAKTLYSFTAHKINKLHGSLTAGSSVAKKQLSDLRKAVGRPPAENPMAWQYVISPEEEETFPEKPEYRQGDQPTAKELAVFTALTLYAVHQQSEQRNMHVAGRTFGSAIGELVSRRTPSIKKRFDSLMQARNYTGLTYHARSLIQLLKQEGTPFDYGRFAEDLEKLQRPDKRNGVITRWSRDFVYGYTRQNKTTNEQ